MDSLPVPHDLPLALPAPEWLLVGLLIGSFVLHILFVNLLVGSTFLTALFQWRGRREPAYATVAYRLAETISVNKSLAVVLGVGPLLTINVLYTSHFYAANAILGMAWLTIIPLVTIAFLLTYAHKYLWHAMEHQQALHRGLIWGALLLFLAIPLIFLANINLMLFPEKWATTHGLLDALLLANVLPRYLHFITATLALTGLFLVWLTGRTTLDEIPGLPAVQLKRLGYQLALGATASQFVIGQLVLFTLPTAGLSFPMIGILLLGVAAAVPAGWWMWREVREVDAARVGRRLWWIVGALGVTVLCMASARHLYRATILAPHREMIAARTTDYQAKVAQALRLGPVKDEKPVGPPGLAAFQTNCGACHAIDRKVVGPAMQEVAKIYAGKPDAFITFVKSPTKTRPDFPDMPSMAHVPNSDLRQIADWVQTLNTQPEKKP